MQRKMKTLLFFVLLQFHWLEFVASDKNLMERVALQQERNNQNRKPLTSELYSSGDIKSESSTSCHDSKDYRSPLNILWTCEHHRTIPCEDFALIGLDKDEVETLLSSCPESCNSTCTRITTEPSIAPTNLESILEPEENISLLVEIDYFLLNKHDYIRESEKQLFEQVSLEYLISFFRKTESNYLYRLKSFAFNSQRFVHHRLRTRRSRRLEDKTLMIVATITFESQKSLLREDLKRKLYLSIEDEKYIQTLQRYFDLDGVELTTSFEAGFDRSQSQTHTSGVGLIVIITLSVFFVLAIVIILLFYRRRSFLKQFTNLSPQKYHESYDKDRMMLDETCRKEKVQKNKDSMKKFTLRVDEYEMKKQKKLNTNPIREEDENHESKIIIPPMIVIDNIDDDISNESPAIASKTLESNDTKEKVLMNVTNLETSAALVLSNQARKSLQASLLLNECLPQQSKIESEKGSPLSLLSSRPSIDETASVMSTPNANFMEKENYLNKTHGQHRRVFSFNPDFDLEPEDDFTILFEKKMKEIGKRSFNLKDLFKRNKVSEVEERSSVQMSNYESDAELSEISSVVRQNDRLSEHMTSLSFDSKSEDSVDEGRNVSPVKAINDSTQSQNLSSEKLSSSGSEDADERDDSTSPWLLYTFEAPISGKLGIVIQSSSKQARNDETTQKKLKDFGPTVLKIKGYSPLLGMVKPGDIIVSVDEVNTQKMSTSEITSLMERKRCQNDDGKIRIAIISKEIKPGFEAESCSHLLIEKENENNEEIQNDLNVFDEYISSPSSESNGSFHLIDTGISEDDDSFHMMAGSEFM